jgi:hypothetical protein
MKNCVLFLKDKKMKRTIIASIFSILMIVTASTLSFGKENDSGYSVKTSLSDVTVFGVTLGKSVTESGVRECRYNRPIPTHKSYDYRDSDCYKHTNFNSQCFTTLEKKLSFPVEIYLILSRTCDLQSPIQEIQVTFNSNDHAKMMLLVKDKFGSPTKTEKLSVQNRMGATFEKLVDSWDLKECSIYLSNVEDKITEGFLRITHPDKTRQDVEEVKKKIGSDRDKF